jgi:sec-independent protein translocase protein TatA
MHAPGTIGIILILIVALLVFGPNKLPELGRAFGKTLREFKNGAKDIMGDEEEKERNAQMSMKPPVRKEISSAEVTVHEVKQEEEPPQKPHNNRRLPD